MSRRDRLIAKIRARPVEARASDVVALLEEFGWVLDRQQGSHMVFTKPGRRSFVVPLVSGRRVTRMYLDQVIELLGLDD
ncbi:MAG: type II toxin-antitoxin system HicA family toxin [Chloroflexi bacterium]|nr:MAG: type II toxin-antitoxin system HicA family toxin [Chloroflexota bacterium]